jgi:branched-chain amino acid transport system permease protein
LSGKARIAALLLIGAALLGAPFLAGDYLLSVLILTLFAAYLGQSWNVMMGFAGQLSLGHSLYIGLGAYVSGVLFVRYGVSPLLGAPLAVAAAVAAAAAVAYLGIRFEVHGVYFALLTIAFAEFTRILFDHVDFVGASGGLFLPVEPGFDPVNLRGGPWLYYYLILAMTAAATWLCHALLQRPIGFYWLAIREDQQAAAASGVPLFRYKMLAVMLSAGLTALAGVFFAFYYNSLFPEQVFSKNRSLELILAPVVGGIGTIAGPLLGAFILTPLGELVTYVVDESGLQVPGAKQIVFGVFLLAIITLKPEGLWPPLKRRLGIGRDPR